MKWTIFGASNLFISSAFTPGFASPRIVHTLDVGSTGAVLSVQRFAISNTNPQSKKVMFSKRLVRSWTKSIIRVFNLLLGSLCHRRRAWRCDGMGTRPRCTRIYFTYACFVVFAMKKWKAVTNSFIYVQRCRRPRVLPDGSNTKRNKKARGICCERREMNCGETYHFGCSSLPLTQLLLASPCPHIW